MQGRRVRDDESLMEVGWGLQRAARRRRGAGHARAAGHEPVRARRPLHPPADRGARGLRRHRRRRHGGERGRARARGGRRLSRRAASSRTTRPGVVIREVGTATCSPRGAARHRSTARSDPRTAVVSESFDLSPDARDPARGMARARRARRVHERRVRSAPPRPRRVPRRGRARSAIGWWSGINDDASVRRLKGPERPLVPDAGRVASWWRRCAAWTWWCCSARTRRQRIIEQVAPDVLVKGGDWAIDQIVGPRVRRSRGAGACRRSGVREGHSTTHLVERIRAGRSALDP